MYWNIAAECISVVTLSIIWAYSRKGNPLPSLRNMIFQGCFLATFCAMVSNILSTVMLAYPQYAPPSLTWAVTMVYFAATPLMGLAYYCYAAAVLYEKRPGVRRVLLWSSLPGAAYLVLVLLNPFTKWLFDVDAQGVYSQGRLILSTYLVFYVYCLAALALTLVRGNWVERRVCTILTAFPVVAVVVIIIQQAFPAIILSGSAATCALLLIYLYLQNKQISIDHLTGLPNRLEFLNMLDLCIQHRACSAFTVVVLSLRDFKQTNDTFGQECGDGILQGIADYLTTAAGPHRLYRFSGDEFAILLEGRDDDGTRDLVQTLLRRMESPWRAAETRCIIGASLGVARYPDSSETVEGLVHGVEYAVQRAKAKRGLTVCYCDQEMLAEIQRRAQIVEILKEKLRNDSFELYYQPILSTESGRFVLAESLLRIPQSPIGPIYPSEFIPIAEETGLIVEMTEQILVKVCQFINRLEREGVELDGVHVNFSAVQFTQPNLAQRVVELVRRQGAPLSKVKIEITESILAENGAVVRAFAEEMHRQGVLLGLDDFGTGYSNLSSVLEMPLDIIKFDKSMLWSAMEEPRAATMMGHLSRAFHELGLSVLVEGVETKAQSRLARSCGVDLIQGYLYAKPVPEEEALRLLKAGGARDSSPGGAERSRTPCPESL